MKPTRLAYLLKKFPRLSETFILNEVLAQQSLGRALRIFSRRPPDDEPRHPQLERLQAAVEVLPGSRELDPYQTLFGEESDSVELCSRVRDIVQSGSRWNHPRFSSLLSEALYLLQRTRKLGVEHLHVHFATDSAITAMLLRNLGGPSFSLTAHAKDIYRDTVNRALLDEIVRSSEFTVTVCDANIRHLKSFLSPEAAGRLKRLYNGVDLDLFSPKPEIAREERHILAVGRLVEKKGFHILLEALKLLKEQGREFNATIVGQGEDREVLLAQTAELGLSDLITWTGAMDQAQVRNLMARATLLCLPCVVGADGNSDALPTVLLEALASGLPTISTPVAGIPEILDEGRVGVLVPVSDPTATAQALGDLLEDAGRRRGIAAAGVKHAAQCFDGREIARTLGGWFDAALLNRSGPEA